MATTEQSTQRVPSGEQQMWLLAAMLTPVPYQESIRPEDVDLAAFSVTSWQYVAAKQYKKGYSADDIRETLSEAQNAELRAVDPNADPKYKQIALALQMDARAGRHMSAADLLTIPNPPDYLVDKLIERESVNCFYGVPGDQKSLLLADMAVCVATGKTWLEAYPDRPYSGYKTKRAPVLWVNGDMKHGNVQERFSAMAKARHITRAADLPIEVLSLPYPALDLGKRDDADLLAAKILVMGAGLVILDNLGNMSGGRDENTTQMMAVMEQLRRIASDTGAAIIVVHHANKTGTMRGSSSILAAFDFTWMVKRDKPNNLVTISPEKERGASTDAVTAQWTWQTDQERRLLEARFWFISAEESANSKNETVDKAIEIIPVVVDIIKTTIGPPSRNALVNGIRERGNVGEVIALRAIERAIEHGVITEIKDGNGQTAARRYYLTHTPPESRVG